MKKKRATTPRSRKRGRKLTAAQARALFAYDKATGIVRWRVRPHPCSRMMPGDRAGSISIYKGFARRQIGYRDRLYKEHRLIWLIVTGAWPRRGADPDHRNGDACDNRWRNLRPASQRQNMQNQRLSKRNRAGLKWVRTLQDKRVKRFQACVGGQFLGNYKTAERAHAVAAAHARKMHGEFYTTRRANGAAQGARM